MDGVRNVSRKAVKEFMLRELHTTNPEGLAYSSEGGCLAERVNRKFGAWPGHIWDYAKGTVGNTPLATLNDAYVEKADLPSMDALVQFINALPEAEGEEVNA